MSRIVSVWLPRWPILRFLAAQAKNPSGKPVDPERPFVLAHTASGGPRVAALNAAAEAARLTLGEPLADARVKTDLLQTRETDPSADKAALRRLALWATRYTPTASPWNVENGADGFFLDIEGAAHLFGGEERLLADLSSRLEGNFGLPARLAVADTPGAAWALSRFHAAPCTILSSGDEADALAAFPVEALRLLPKTCTTLRRLGFKTVGALLGQPRAPFAARFPAELLWRLDQALGRVDEPLVPVVPPPVYHSLRYLLEPIITQEAAVALAKRLMHTLARVLARDDVGARALRLSLYNVDGAVETIEVGLTLPTRDVAHVARLFDLKLEALSAMQEAGFGFEAVGLAVTRAEPIDARQYELVEDDSQRGQTERCAVLIDKLRQRLGPHSVRRFENVASHMPERAEKLASVAPPTARPRDPPTLAWRASAGCQSAGARSAKAESGDPDLDSCLRGNERQKNERETTEWLQPGNSRPLLILPRAEPTDVVAIIPDGPPRRFNWRGMTHEVVGSEGPERIGAEWWRKSDGHRSPEPTRDYYLVEDSGGHRFWLYREGLYGRETTAARWFVHGLFA